MKCKLRNPASGFALLIVLLIIAVLTGMVTEFMFTTKLHAELNSNYRSRVRARYLARSAINAFQYLLEVNQLAPGQNFYGASSWVGYGSGFEQMEGAEIASAMLGLGDTPITPPADGPLIGQWSIGLPSRLFDVDGEIFGRITNERGKINLNAIITRKGDPTQDEKNQIVYNQILSLLQLLGVKDDDATVLLDSLVDWIDGNSSTEPKGAEDDYYRGLKENPYYARNDFMLSLDELRLVRGCNQEIFDMIKDFVTVYPRATLADNALPDARIDPNAAPKMVLMAVFLAVRPSGSDTSLNDPEIASKVADDIYHGALQKASPSVTIQGGQASFAVGQALTPQEVQGIIAGRMQGTFNWYPYSGLDPQYYTAIGAGKVNNMLGFVETVLKYAQNRVEILQWIED